MILGTSSLSPMECPCHLQGIPGSPPIPRCLIPTAPGDIVPVPLGVVPVAPGAALFPSLLGYCSCSPRSAPLPPGFPYSPQSVPVPQGCPIPRARGIVPHPCPQACPIPSGVFLFSRGSHLPSKISAPPPVTMEPAVGAGPGRGRDSAVVGVTKGGAPANGAWLHRSAPPPRRT